LADRQPIVVRGLVEVDDADRLVLLSPWQPARVHATQDLDEALVVGNGGQLIGLPSEPSR
jgi:hypothetical protein